MIHVTLTAAGHEVLEAEGGVRAARIGLRSRPRQEESRDEEKRGRRRLPVKVKTGRSFMAGRQTRGQFSWGAQIVGATSGPLLSEGFSWQQLKRLESCAKPIDCSLARLTTDRPRLCCCSAAVNEVNGADPLKYSSETPLPSKIVKRLPLVRLAIPSSMRGNRSPALGIGPSMDAQLTRATIPDSVTGIG